MKVLINNSFTKTVNNKIVEDLYLESLNSNISNVAGVRGEVLKKNINGTDLVVRRYRRGGLVRYFLKDTFIKPLSNSYRPIQEFEILNSIKKLNVPKVIAVAVKESSLTYSGIIITENIKDSFNFLNQKPSSNEEIKEIAYKAGLLARKIINEKVFHPDLHLGNVLYDKNGEVYIIDFDKASVINKDEIENSINKIVSRWNRSVNKFLSSSTNKDIYIDSFSQGIKN